MGVILMDDSDAKQLQTDQMPPLDVSDLAVTWPKWRQQFQIYILAVHDQVPDRRKLAIFLNCLGSPGIAVATKYFPQLQDFDSVAAKEISFEQLWSHFDHLCTMAEPGTVSKSMDNFHFYELINYRFDGDLYKTRIELLSAAKKCGFQCHVCQTSYADRLVRDQLMECLPEQEKNVLKYLLQFKNPSSQTLVSQYNALHKVRNIFKSSATYPPTNNYVPSPGSQSMGSCTSIPLDVRLGSRIYRKPGNEVYRTIVHRIPGTSANQTVLL